MRNSKTLAKIRAGQPAKVGYLGHFVPLYVAHAAKAGFDAIWFDNEHRTMEPREVQSLMAIFHLYDIDCFLRTPTREKSQLYRYLEDGVIGLIIPLVESAADAEDLVQKVKFPPLGDRGIEGKGLDADFGFDTNSPEKRAAYVDHANRETVLVVQLESPNAVQNAESIVAVEGVDMLFIGPADFALRSPKDGSGMSWDEAVKHVAQVAAKHGKPWGVMPKNTAEIAAYHQQNAQFIPWALDTKILIDGVQQAGKELDDIYS